MTIQILKNIIITLSLTLSASAQTPSNSLQSARLLKTEGKLSLEIKPKNAHHFNLEAPTSVQKNGVKIAPTTSTSVITVPVSSEGKCNYVIQTYVCDDKKTFCSPQKLSVSCAQIKDLESHSDMLKKKSVDLSEFSPEGSALSLENKSEKKENKTSSKAENFIVNDPKMAFELAQKNNKPLFIDFFGVWCPPCNVLDETVFHASKFTQMAKNFVLLKLDADDKVSWDLKSRYSVKGYPTVIMTTPAGDEITRFSGAIPEGEIIKMMSYSLKNKKMGLAQKIETYKTKPTPALAWEIVEAISATENYPAALPYIAHATIHPKLTTTQKELLLLIPYLASKHTSEESAKFNLPILKDLFENYPVTDNYYWKLDFMYKTAELLKDKDLKKWVNEVNIKNIHASLSKPVHTVNTLTRMDLFSLAADSYETLEQTENFKKAHASIIKEIDRLIVLQKQNPKTNRGYNLDRIYSIYKSGDIQKARVEYEKMISIYPHEFSFHYNYGSVLKDLKDWDQALKSAQDALTYSYGDNQLRAIYLVSEIEFNKGLKKEPIERLSRAITTTELPKDETVRTHRYVKRLAELKKKIEDGKTTN